MNHTSWIEINTDALKHNLAGVKALVEPSVKIMAVVKADAYGHGIVGASKAFVEGGADYLGVTTLEEGLQIREAGIGLPVLVFSPLLPEQMDAALENDLEQTVCDLKLAQYISQAAENAGRQAKVHVKIDTGMGRLGIMPEESLDFISGLQALPGIRIAGIYTHFANSGLRDRRSLETQNAVFKSITDMLVSKEISTGICHAANSAAILNLPSSHYDMVRPGTILYGQYPTRFVERKLDLQDTWTLKTRVIAIRKLTSGSQIGYGSEFTSKRETVSAVLPIGYSDGFTVIPESVARRSMTSLTVLKNLLSGTSGGPYVTIKGKRAPVLGRVSMQMCSVDVTDIPDVAIGDEVIVPARRTTVSSRIPRVYSM